MAPGRIGQALSLTNGGYFEIPDSPAVALTREFSVEAWVHPLNTDGRIVDKATAGKDDAYNLDAYPGNRIRFITPAGSVGTSDPIPTKAWTHVAATCSAVSGKLHIFINGELMAEATGMVGARIPENGNPVRVGADSNGGNPFRGRIDEVRIYQRLLSDEEIKIHAQRE